MKTMPPAVVRIWMPALLVTGAYLFFHDQSPAYWLIPLPLVLALVFMTTLAEIEDCGKAVRIKYWWGSRDVDKGRIAEIRPFFLDDIGVIVRASHIDDSGDQGRIQMRTCELILAHLNACHHGSLQGMRACHVTACPCQRFRLRSRAVRLCTAGDCGQPVHPRRSGQADSYACGYAG